MCILYTSANMQTCSQETSDYRFTDDLTDIPKQVYLNSTVKIACYSIVYILENWWSREAVKESNYI